MLKATAIAKHVCKQFENDLIDKVITIKEDRDGGYYCQAKGLGCSKTYHYVTPSNAVVMFLDEYAYTEIKVTIL